ncbi:type II pantothenate kinase [Oceanobacillus bengalensis]|uniref:Type II pantothenate kinase n=1 Tax=Oceanobacillus bengalensis TaxID=1435466 RepID=A0A494YX34_9BACI|nr:type II pantothenate kinase [Oceanobacillus bengalensis]RKQ14773.1 type II pantothenate kinase [Oceanobacillus bengalensis]
MPRKIGIDAGGSLIKVAYEEQGNFHVKTYGNEETKQLLNWLGIISPESTLLLTGGKAQYIKEVAKQRGHLIEEFSAVVEGTRYLLRKEKLLVNEDFILVSIGTGTSVFHVKADSYERMFGSGIGGGTLMGLGSLITGRNDYHHLIELANKGKHENSDLLVKDIYAPNEPPIFGYLTAANFGKAHLNEKARVEDHVAALAQLVGETIISLAAQAAGSKQVGNIVFVGSTLQGNAPLRDVLIGFQRMMDYEAVFLENGPYAGAIGAHLIG